MEYPAQQKPHWTDLLGYLFLSVMVGLIIYGVMRQYWKELDIKATSIEKKVMVIGKRKGGGKTPNIVYIQDGIIPIGVPAQTRWYWQCKKGSVTTVRFSLKHHAYQDPFRKIERHKYFAYFFGLMWVLVLGQTISLIYRMLT